MPENQALEKKISPKEPTKNKKVHGGILTLAGYLLSPFSWWNDLILNIPIAYFFAWPFGLISRQLFLPAMIIGYWLTNILGLLLIHHGAIKILGSNHDHAKNKLLKNILVATIYTGLIFTLAKINLLSLPDLNCLMQK